jgi:hypothetical protein
MSNRPEYPSASLFERAAYAVVAGATGIGLLVAVVAAFQSQLPEPLAGQAVVARAACERPAPDTAACMARVAESAVIASR